MTIRGGIAGKRTVGDGRSIREGVGECDPECIMDMYETVKK